MSRTITKTIEVFTFDELDDTAKDNALTEWLYLGDYWHSQDEWTDSAEAFSKIAPVDYTGADFDYGTVDYVWAGDVDIAELEGLRAWKWLKNNGWFDLAEKNASGGCTLTGYCGDCPLFDPIHALRNDPNRVPHLEQLFYECLQSWVQEARSDLEYAQSEESFSETCEANQWEFTANGEMI